MNASRASVVARRALALARAGVGTDDGVPVILRSAGGDKMVLELAYSRVLAVLDADPRDARAARALDMLGRSLERYPDSP